jgi:hypothetical protein
VIISKKSVKIFIKLLFYFEIHVQHMFYSQIIKFLTSRKIFDHEKEVRKEEGKEGIRKERLIMGRVLFIIIL